MSDSDSDDVPDAATCQSRCEEFVSITGTDEACAQFYLQDRGWNVERAVNAFFDAAASPGVKILQDGDTPEMVVNVNREMANAMRRSMVEEQVKKFKFITWNIDGLDDRNLNIRIKAVCKIIKSEDADIVHLQEVVPSTLSYLKSNLQEYMCIAGNNVDYFCATLLKKKTAVYQSHNVIPFHGSIMGRNLIVVKVLIGGASLTLLNSHLESTAEHSAERKNQLKIGFRISTDAKPNETVLFAGDLNLRDKDISESGGIPASIKDLWIACGMRKECQYTWDCQRNTNIQMSGRFKPRCRFDRVYQRSSTDKVINAKHFGLVGIEKVKGSQCFPSDHWGIVLSFDIDQKTSSN